MLFGDGVDGADDSLAFDDLCEICDDFIPDMALDNSETQRMILEIIDAEPNSQRQVVMIYYSDNITIDQIATLTACPTGTVKSRLNYARKQIKAGVKSMRKKPQALWRVKPSYIRIFSPASMMQAW